MSCPCCRPSSILYRYTHPHTCLYSPGKTLGWCVCLCVCLQGKEPSVRQLALLHFRNIIALNLKLDEALSRPRARVPPSIIQMLLILQVHKTLMQDEGRGSMTTDGGGQGCKAMGSCWGPPKGSHRKSPQCEHRAQISSHDNAPRLFLIVASVFVCEFAQSFKIITSAPNQKIFIIIIFFVLRQGSVFALWFVCLSAGRWEKRPFFVKIGGRV